MVVSGRRRRSATRFGIAFGGLVFLVLASGNAQASLRTQDLDEHYLTGYLTWNQQAGGISWDPAAPTEALGGATGPQQAPRDKAATLAYALSGDTTALTTETFVSEAVPFSFHLNVTRVIQLDLFFSGFSCATLYWDFELRVDGTILGGNRATDETVAAPWGPKAADGQCARPLRFHPEVAFIPKGAILSLSVVRDYDSSPVLLDQDLTLNPRYVTQGAIRSVLRIPLYSAEEILHRIPATSGSGGNVAASYQVGGPSVPAAAIGAAALGSALGGRRKRVVLLAALLAAGALTGCVGTGQKGAIDNSQDPELAGSASASYLENQGPTDASEDALAGVVGVVHDDLGIAVAGAHVTILGSDRFDRTDERGRFEFQNLTAGVRRIRVDANDFRSYEGDVDLRRGSIARLEITLLSLVDRDLRPHRHDYWGAATTVTLLDQSLSLRSGNWGGGVVLPNGQTYPACVKNPFFVPPLFCRLDLQLPAPKPGGEPLVRPGTYDVEVTIDWDPQDNQVRRAGVGFIANNEVGYNACTEAHPCYQINRTLMHARASGVPTHIRTGWEMTDVGHQLFSNWRLFVYVEAKRYNYETANGPFHVVVKLHKGVVPLEPAHRDFWRGRDEVAVLDQAQLKLACSTTRCTLPDAEKGWIPYALVPPGANRLTLKLEQSAPTLPAPYDFGLLYKPANVPPPIAGDYSQYRELSPKEIQPGQKTYELLLTAEEADPFYARRSYWHFLLDDDQDGSIAFTNEVTFFLTVHAHKDGPAEIGSSTLALISWDPLDRS